MSDNIGIYYIQNTVTKQLYIGQTTDLRERKKTHFYMLKTNTHFNIRLQNSFNKYGIENFEFGVIEYCDSSKLLELEKAYIDFYNAKKHGFNINDGGRVVPDNSNEKHGMWRKDMPNEKIKEMYLGEFTTKEIAGYFGCSRRTIERRLNKIFTPWELDEIKKKKRLTGKCNIKLEYLPHDEIKELYLKGHTQKELSEIHHCTTDMIRKSLKLSLGKDYAKIKESLFPKKEPVKSKKRDPIIIDLDELASLYKQGYSSRNLAKKYNCSKHSILKRLREVFEDDYESVKLESSQNREVVKDEDILKLANKEYNSLEIAEKLGCSDTTVMWRLRKLYTPKQYDEYKSKNRSRKMSEIYKNHYTPESKLKRINKVKKYSLWDGSHVHYNKTGSNDWNSTFYARFNARDVPTSKFIDFISPQIVYDLICDFS